MKLIRQELEKIYDQYGYQLFACALSVLGNKELAEDAVHDAFCRCLRLAELPNNFRAYLFRSVRNAAVDILR